MHEKQETITVKESMELLADMIASGNIPKADRAWAGADVCIVRRVPAKKGDGFYPDPRYVETKYSLELSWFFFKLKDAFYAENLLDGCSKIEFFGRLANAAIRAIAADPEIPCPDLCRTVVLEAETIYDELTHGEFHCRSLGFGNEISDDHRESRTR